MSTNVRSLLTEFTGGRLREIFNNCNENQINNAEELRIRADKPLLIKKPEGEFFITAQGELSGSPSRAYKPCSKDIANCIEIMSNFSLYAFSEEIKNGYITLKGGHRVGVSGRTVVEGGTVKTIKNINGLNIRVTREIIGCADKVMDYIRTPDYQFYHTMIISPPGCGKTTLLRDIVRQISDGGKNVGVADERSEIAGCYMGKPQNDVGLRTDVLDGCPKAEGMIMLLRAMTPDIIAVDEIGRREDIYAIEDIINAGITLVCTVHGSGIDDILERPVLQSVIEKNIFKRFIILSSGGQGKAGRLKAVCNEKFVNIGGRTV